MRIFLPALSIAWMFVSCTNIHQPAGNEKRTDGTTVAPAQPAAYKKPVRMNGRGKMTMISLESFFSLYQSGKVLLYDARPAFFYNLGHIPGAINVPRGTTDEQLSKREGEIKQALADGKTIVTYCTGVTCPDARTLADHLSGFGHPVTIFSGGWHAWTEAELPTE